MERSSKAIRAVSTRDRSDSGIPGILWRMKVDEMGWEGAAVKYEFGFSWSSITSQGELTCVKFGCV